MIKKLLVEAYSYFSRSVHNHLSVCHQVHCYCYPCLVDPPCRAEVSNPSRVVQRSMESILIPKFSGHLIGIAPVYVLCQLGLCNSFEIQRIGTA